MKIPSRKKVFIIRLLIIISGVLTYITLFHLQPKDVPNDDARSYLNIVIGFPYWLVICSLLSSKTRIILVK